MSLPAESAPSVVITGLGLMGGSLAAALSRAGWSVDVHHHRPEVASAAAARGWGRAIQDFSESTAQVAVICTPVSTIPAIAKQIAIALPSAAITDVGSTKGALCTAITEPRFVGSHPMCGSHLQGLAHADPHLYQGRLTILTPTATTDGAALTLVRRLWHAAGCRLLETDPNTHDRLVAEASHLPHILASLTASQLTAAAAPVAAGGFRDSTRIAGASSDLWADILASNASAIAPLLQVASERLAELSDHLAKGDHAAIARWLAAGRDGRQRFDALH